MSRILLGVSGGIAAYKALELVRLATGAGHAVRVVQTPASRRFVGAASFEALTGAPVLAGEHERDPARGAYPGQPLPAHEPLSHLELAARAEVYVIAPASANTIAKLAAGLADNLLSSCALAADCPLVIAPAMNNRMYEHPATQANLRTLADRGAHIVEPASGRLASKGEHGIGRLAEPAAILAACERALAGASSAPAGMSSAPAGASSAPTGISSASTGMSSAPAGISSASAGMSSAPTGISSASAGMSSAPAGASSAPAEASRPWSELKVLVTAGGTREPIDSVRFLGNSSSGRMGLALARAARARGAEVTAIAANVALEPPAGVAWHEVRTAAELCQACEREFPACDILLMVAAVADFRPATPAGGKIKKAGRERLTLALEPTTDVIARLAAQRRAGQTLVGFAAEHGERAVARGREKLAGKDLDMVVVNDISRGDIGFEADANEVTIVTAGERSELVPRASKDAIAEAILDAVERVRSAPQRGG